MNVHFINHNSISYTQWSLVGISICVCVHDIILLIDMDFPNLFNKYMAPPGSTTHKLGITVTGEGKSPTEKYTPQTNSFTERKWHSNSWMILPTLPLFYSFQHYQNVDGHNTDNFPVYMVLIVGLLHNKISIWQETLSSISCVYISCYKWQGRILWRVT